jgi:hypothetical protein
MGRHGSCGCKKEKKEKCCKKDKCREKRCDPFPNILPFLPQTLTGALLTGTCSTLVTGGASLFNLCLTNVLGFPSTLGTITSVTVVPTGGAAVVLPVSSVAAGGSAVCASGTPVTLTVPAASLVALGITGTGCTGIGAGPATTVGLAVSVTATGVPFPTVFPDLVLNRFQCPCRKEKRSCH